LPVVFKKSIGISKISIRLIRKIGMCPLGAHIFGGNNSSGSTGRSVSFLDFYKINDWQVS
jgi:hypothetical protein